MKSIFTHILEDRAFLLLLVAVLFLSILITIFAIFRLEPSDVQIVTHYTGFGLTNFYRDQWYYLLTLPVFVILVGVLNSALAIKLHGLKKRPLAVVALVVTICLLVVSAILINALTRIATL